MIDRAGTLDLRIDKSEVEEFVYTHFVDSPRESGAWLIPEDYHYDAERSKLQATSQVYREFLSSDSAERDAVMERYLDSFFGGEPTPKQSP